MGYIDYSDKSVSMSKWLEEIAPKYFDFPSENIHRTSQFGYMNEVMSTIENDTHHAVSIARREFYPTTAKYLKSFYKMGALQKISYPMANPAVATAILIIKQEDILKYGRTANPSFINGGDTYEFVLDNTMILYAGNIPFMLDYPIRILAKKATKVFSSNTSIVTSEYAYTVYYDTRKENSLNTTASKYIKSRVYKHGAETLLLIKVALRQCIVQNYSTGINSSPILNNISIEFPFSGDMCNFEVSYSEAYSEVSTNLLKLPLNSNPSSTREFCMYSMDDKQTLRLTFPENAWFTPKFNSTIDVRIFTTLGEKGNFSQYAGPLVCKMNSQDFPYNNLISITGKIVGSSVGGYSFPDIEDFKNDVIAAYATNKTITTSQDLQIMFDSIAMDTRNRIIFDKRRDDVFERLYGAYMLFKDLNGHVIPTNSITGEIRSGIGDEQNFGDFDTVSKSESNANETGIIKPGRVWKYHAGVVECPIQEMDDDGMYKFSDAEYSIYDSLLATYGEWIFDFIFANVNSEVKSLHQIMNDYIKAGNKSVSHLLSIKNDIFANLYSIVGGNPVFKTKMNEVTGEPDFLTQMLTIDGRDHCINDYDRDFTVYPTNINLNTLNETDDDMLYTNPFLIRVNSDRGVVGYYQTTFDTTLPMDMQEANKDSLVQFNISNLNVYRNAIAGENFYKISLQLQPSISDSNLSSVLLTTPEEYGANMDSSFVQEIRAQFNGIVEKFIYVPGPKSDDMQYQLRRPGSVYMIIRYDTTSNPRSWTKYVNDSEVNKLIDTDHCIAIKISGGVEAYNERTGRSQFVYTPWFDTAYRAGDTFMQGDIIAIAKSMDTGTLRVIAEIKDSNNKGIIEGYYIPFTLDRYDELNDSYIYSAYLSTSDEITYNDQLVIDYGLFDADGAAVNTITMKPTDCHIRVSTFVKYDDMNVPQEGINEIKQYPYAYCRGYTCTNEYENIEPFNLLKPFDFIRSVMTSQVQTDNNYEPSDPKYFVSMYYRLHEIPLIRAGWMQNPGNVFDIFEILSNNYEYLYQVYDLLENNYSIDMKFFNTFGKSRYYMIGMKCNEDLNDLETVSIKLRFGIRVNQLTDAAEFDERFIKYVNTYIESFNDIENQGKSIFIMDLITSIKNKFGDELEYIEYYGVNNWDADTSQVIESWPIDKIEALGYRKYIPEFINLYSTKKNGVYTPYVNITHVE